MGKEKRNRNKKMNKLTSDQILDKVCLGNCYPIDNECIHVCIIRDRSNQKISNILVKSSDVYNYCKIYDYPIPEHINNVMKISEISEKD